MNYLAILNYCNSEEDSFEEGCIGGMLDKTYNLSFKGDSLEDVKKQIMEFHGFEELEFDDGIYRSAVHEDEDGIRASERDIELWKKGKKRLFYVETGYKIYKMKQIRG